MQTAAEQKVAAAVLEEVAVVSLVALVLLRQLTPYLATQAATAEAVHQTAPRAVVVVLAVLVGQPLLAWVMTYLLLSVAHRSSRLVAVVASRAAQVVAV